MAAASGVAWRTYPPEQMLVERFGITTGFHAGQQEIIELLLRGRRVLAIQHTGWGKSLCYQVASLYYPHLTIVFSPLKALMRDQCQRCNDMYHIPAAIVSSDFSAEENRATLALAVRDEIKVLFIAPERLENADWQAAVLQMQISMVVIDEAHCISVDEKWDAGGDVCATGGRAAGRSLSACAGKGAADAGTEDAVQSLTEGRERQGRVRGAFN
ncbi:MAG TPA: DEAD/DEAH box helicase [Ktedonobacteraceae bacterium]|nr:DEAD/DEAH box helicase [Ktedonobacteraceae bacterium]